jgi:hypothetical protein
MLWRSGFHVTPHPQLAGTDRTPDFLAVAGDASFYEAAVIVERQEEAARRAHHTRWRLAHQGP